MRKLAIVLAAVFAISVIAAAAMAATGSSNSYGSSKTTMVRHHRMTSTSWSTRHWKSMAGSRARGPWRHRLAMRWAKRHAIAARTGMGPGWRCFKIKKHVRRFHRPACVARGPIVNVPQQPAPVINVPQQAAPVVNVPQQPAPVVNIPAAQPPVAVTSDSCNIYVVQGNQLMVYDKNTYCLKQTIPIVPGGITTGGSGAGTTAPSE